MRVAVAGATGNIGALTAAALERDGHDVARISRSLGVDLLTGDGLDEALAGVEALVDATNATATDPDEVEAFFGTTTRNLLAAEQRAGVRHHVLLSIVGIHRVEGNAHYAGKREQERLVSASSVPWTILPATQFHDFAAMVTSWTESLAPRPRTSSTWPGAPTRCAAARSGLSPHGRACSAGRWRATCCCPARVHISRPPRSTSGWPQARRRERRRSPWCRDGNLLWW